jgi:hypothetical protein
MPATWAPPSAPSTRAPPRTWRPRWCGPGRRCTTRWAQVGVSGPSHSLVLSSTEHFVACMLKKRWPNQAVHTCLHPHARNATAPTRPEPALREARARALAAAHDPDHAARCVSEAIASADDALASLRSQISDLAAAEAALDGKLERRRAEVERAEKRLATLAAVRPAYMDEYQSLEGQLQVILLFGGGGRGVLWRLCPLCVKQEMPVCNRRQSGVPNYTTFPSTNKQTNKTQGPLRPLPGAPPQPAVPGGGARGVQRRRARGDGGGGAAAAEDAAAARVGGGWLAGWLVARQVDEQLTGCCGIAWGKAAMLHVKLPCGI